MSIKSEIDRKVLALRGLYIPGSICEAAYAVPAGSISPSLVHAAALAVHGHPIPAYVGMSQEELGLFWAEYAREMSQHDDAYGSLCREALIETGIVEGEVDEYELCGDETEYSLSLYRACEMGALGRPL